ncbi:MAG: CBS domain-containing protein [Pseudomonadota bacterium]
MKIKDRPEFASKPAPLTGRRHESVFDAAKRMSSSNYGSIVIVDDDNKVVGMVTERDFMRRLVAENRSPQDTKLGDIMTHDIRVAKEDDDLLEWLRIMSNERFRRLPIVDESGRLTSIMTQGDFVSYTWPQLLNLASTLAKSTISNSYQIALIAGGILLYTFLILGMAGLM